MKKVMVILASLTMVVMVSGAALAAGPGTKGKASFQGPQLTQEQVQQIEKARAKFMTDTLALRQKMAAKAMELKTLYVQPKPDKAKIKALALELVDLRSAIAKKRIEAFSGLPIGPGFGRGGFRHGGFGPGGFGHMGFGRGSYGPGGRGGFGPGSCPGFGAGFGPSGN